MNLLDIMPLLAVFMGTALLVFVLTRRMGLGKDKKVRWVLAGLIFIYTFMALDYYIAITTHGNSSYFGLSYLLNHFIGFLFFVFIVLFTGTPFNPTKWFLVMGVYTLLRWALFYPLFRDITLSEYLAFTQETEYTEWLELEYLSFSLLNILLTFLAFFRLRKAPMVLHLDERQSVKFQWAKLFLLAIVILQMAVFVKDLITNITVENFEVSMKLEALLITVFFFVFAFSIMHFPVFAFTGNFEDLPKAVKTRYAKSSLRDSTALFKEVQAVVEEERLYLEYDLKLNTIAEKLGKSLHHVSQAINQSTGKGFSDFINSFRIADAKKKLLEPRPDTIFAISLDVGFNSKAAFYSAFKKATGQTPTEFKRAHNI
ncbi:MAG: helix-turn-helix domain-containing protein [Bacteroidota bacterium]